MIHDSEQEHDPRRRDKPAAAGLPPEAQTPATPASEFLCPGCGRPLAIALRSDMCLAEAQVYCPDCERDYQERRGRWAGR